MSAVELSVVIPIRNEALNIDFEPRVDRALLWEIWTYLKDAGLKDVQMADWKIDPVQGGAGQGPARAN